MLGKYTPLFYSINAYMIVSCVETMLKIFSSSSLETLSSISPFIFTSSSAFIISWKYTDTIYKVVIAVCQFVWISDPNITHNPLDRFASNLIGELGRTSGIFF